MNMMNTNVASTPQYIELPELSDSNREGSPILSGHLDVIKNVKVKLVARLGETTMSVGELMQMKSNQVLKLDTPLNGSVDVLLDGNIIARGQLVAVDDNFGIQITELSVSNNL